MSVNLRISACSALILLFSSNSFAGLFPENGKGEGIWRVSGTAVYLQQSANIEAITEVGPVELAPIGSASLTSPFFMIDSPYDWGWGVDLAYIFPSHKYDVKASYLQINSSQNESTSQAFDTGSLHPVKGTAELEDKMTYDFSTADLIFGHYIKFNPRLISRVGVGLVFVDIDQKANTHATVQDNVASGNDIDVNVDSRNTFIGGGPKFTFDTQFDLIEELGVVAGLGVSAVLGSSEVSIHGVDENNSDHNSSEKNEGNKFVFGLDAKLGLRYGQLILNAININIEAGYQGITYLNVLQNASDVVAIESVSTYLNGGSTTVNYDADYYNFGPYVTVGIDFL